MSIHRKKKAVRGAEGLSGGNTRNAVVTVNAPAKVNFFLKVLGLRPDGYHEIESLVCPVSLWDILEFELRDDGQIKLDMQVGDVPGCRNLEKTGHRDNLAVKAASLLQERSGCAVGADIRLKKRIPVGGGLGGGSSDAAAVLIGLNALWALDVEKRQLMEMGAELGCDVPALVHGGMTLVEGAGERVRYPDVDLSGPAGKMHLVLANPGFSVSTGDIYSRYNGGLTTGHGEVSILVLTLVQGEASRAAGLLRNDVQEVVFRKYPLIEILAENLRAAGAIDVLLSGSGAT
ncbi:MAG: 4-(cytidine 5'-diphospho)-2-C-methyl-D-erythritol kinase, partial [Verrucomicrobiota bacterium]